MQLESVSLASVAQGVSLSPSWRFDPVAHQWESGENKEPRINIRRTIGTLQSASYGLLRMSELTSLHVLSLRLETVEYQAVVQALYEMLQQGIYPQWVFASPQVYIALCDAQLCQDHLALSDSVDGKAVGQSVQFVGVPGLDEHLVLFGFFK